jgi:hypothetical protein
MSSLSLFCSLCFKNKSVELGMVAHACNPITRRLREKDHEFEAGLGYIARCYLMKPK